MILALAVPVHAATAPLPTALQVLGSVTNAARPVASALVIALNLNTLEANQTFSGVDGNFVLPPLPAAVYKIIAVKSGFAPAVAMVVPVKEKLRVALKLQSEKASDPKANQRIWELRATLPPDVLREVDNVLFDADPEPAPITGLLPMASSAPPRFSGEMMSMTALSPSSAAATAQTALGVESRLNDSWQLGFRGNLHRVVDPSSDATFGTPLAESSVMSMELRSSPTEAYRVASTKSWWRYANDAIAPQEADLRSHNFEWEHGDTRMQVRYLAQQNLFAANPGSDLIEVGGNTTVLQSGRSDLGVAVRVTQESLRNTNAATVRTADLTASANLDVASSLILQYGLSSRIGVYGTEWAPRTGFEWKIGKTTSLVVSGLYKVYEQDRANVLPSIVVWSDGSHVLPRYSYSVGLVSSDDSREGFSAVATVTQNDMPLRVIFTDASEQFWDGLYVDKGDISRDVRLSYRKELLRRVLVNLAGSAGVVQPGPTNLTAATKHFVTGDLESTYQPTGTMLAISYREMRQPLTSGDYRSARVNLRVAQPVHVLLDLKLLAGVELARAENSPYLLDTIDPNGLTRKYIGGVAVNF